MSSYNTVTVTTSATQIVGAQTSRKELIISNTSTSIIVYLGQDANVTTSNGIPLYQGQTTERAKTLGEWLGPVYGIVGSGTSDVRYWEVTTA